MKKIGLIFALLLTGCTTTEPASLPADGFFRELSALCGKSFEGKLAAGDESDASFNSAKMRAHVRECSSREVRIAFDVGEDKSRTWIISKTDTGLRLKHRHMLKDGTEDPVSQYGGDTVTSGSVMRQEFPADAFSKDMFTKEGRTVSNANIWAFEVTPRQVLTYELARPGRLFRVSFDLTKPVSGAGE